MAKDKSKSKEVKPLSGTKEQEAETEDAVPKAKKAEAKPKEADPKAANPTLGSKEDPPPQAKAQFRISFFFSSFY